MKYLSGVDFVTTKPSLLYNRFADRALRLLQRPLELHFPKTYPPYPLKLLMFHPDPNSRLCPLEACT